MRGFMFRKTLLVIISILILTAFSACSYFLPSEKEVIPPELIKSEDIVLPLVEIRRGDLIAFHDISAAFVPEPIKIATAELEVSGLVSEIYYNVGEMVTEGDLVIELDTDKIDEQIMVQDISLEKARLSYERNLALYEKGEVDRYTLEFSGIALEAAQNHMDDLVESRRKHYVYAPSDGTIVNMLTAEGSNAFGDVFTLAVVEEGLFEILIDSNLDGMSPAQESIIALDIGDEVQVIYEGEIYEGKVFRDTSMYYTEVEYDAAYTHTQILTDTLPDSIAFNRKVTVRNVTEQAEDVVVIPVSAVYGITGEPYTYVVDGTEITKVYIELGMTDYYFYEVVSGLSEGDSILKIN